MVAVGVQEKQVFGNLAQIRINEAPYQFLLAVRIQVQVRCMEQRLCSKAPQVFGQQRQTGSGNQGVAQVFMRTYIFHDDGRASRIKMIHPGHEIRAILATVFEIRVRFGASST